MLKKYSLIISIVYSLLLAALSLLKINAATAELPTNSDKIFHTIAYFIFTVLWYFALRTHGILKAKSIIFAFLSSALFGILIEILQGTLTENRQSDVNDIIANIIGTLIAVILIMSKKSKIKKQ
ncbi:VanZ family protein [Lacinutrix sp. 5H-3-7-4]|uniref:VanZ family protein n=1 Tax=Lacinutrix sp. (strain 5H-3-7-4) TaxID=983544 RepID=UPI00020A374B|nr:VanZ family protein [Lacinutrix sp. 5H-3-7-4]AEH01227.1 VanZ family protein [Lacinutrix sp. 5H-3-7-4]